MGRDDNMDKESNKIEKVGKGKEKTYGTTTYNKVNPSMVIVFVRVVQLSYCCCCWLNGNSGNNGKNIKFAKASQSSQI